MLLINAGYGFFFFFKKFQKKENSVSEWVEGRIKLPYICGPENEKKKCKCVETAQTV